MYQVKHDMDISDDFFLVAKILELYLELGINSEFYHNTMISQLK